MSSRPAFVPLVSCRVAPGGRWRAVSSRRSAARPSGAGSARTHFNPGAIAPGFSRGIRSSPRKAGQVLDLYQPRWKGAALGSRDYALCTDEKTSIQARQRTSLPPAAGRPVYVEYEYRRAGALAYLAAWDVHRAKLFGRCEHKNGIAAFERLVAQVMGQEPYRSARRVFFIADKRLLSPRPASGGSTTRQMAEYHPGPHADPCQLARPD